MEKKKEKSEGAGNDEEEESGGVRMGGWEPQKVKERGENCGRRRRTETD